MNDNFTKYSFTESVKQVQEQYGSRKSYSRMELSGDRNVLTDREKPFIESRDSFYLATVGENGWPYLQFRGGPKGFLKIIDDTTLGFADFRGNRQYISAGNIISTKKTSLFLIDYPKQQRLKIWAESEVHHAAEEPELVKSVEISEYKALIERIFIMKIKAFDWNCPQHITPRYTTDEIAKEISLLNPTIVESCYTEQE